MQAELAQQLRADAEFQRLELAQERQQLRAEAEAFREQVLAQASLEQQRLQAAQIAAAEAETQHRASAAAAQAAGWGGDLPKGQEDQRVPAEWANVSFHRVATVPAGTGAVRQPRRGKGCKVTNQRAP